MIEPFLDQLFGTSADKELEPLGGGDIGKSFKATYDGSVYFCKRYTQEEGYLMVKAEKEGLQTIAKTATIAVPRVIACEPLDPGGLLVLQYLQEERVTTPAMERLGKELANLHNIPREYFGAKDDNYIGRLEQQNIPSQDWAAFYCDYRLLPQYQKAFKNGLLQKDEVPSRGRILEPLQQYTAEVRPSLLHGDLWSGNYLISSGGRPYLIDPSVYCGDRVVDLAMTQLFGGFETAFYKAYRLHSESLPYEEERIAIYQLYYLLVHLNLFGRSYKGSVMRTTREYFL